MLLKFKISSAWWQVVIAMLVQAVSAGSIFTGYGVVVAPLKMEFELCVDVRCVGHFDDIGFDESIFGCGD